MTRPEPRLLLESAEKRVPGFLSELAALVAIDSGTDSPRGVNLVVDRMERAFDDSAWKVERLPMAAGGRTFGDALVARVQGSGNGKVLVIGHTDTVFPDGTAADRPLRIDGDRAYGPGVCDMKAGLLTGFHAVEILRELGDPFEQVTFICNPEEERGSPASSALIAREALASDAVLVLESARESGAVVTARKGVTTAEISIEGRAAHAGVEPERGRSALLQAAYTVRELHSLNGRFPGATVNVGVLEGGTRPNVVAGSARLEVDVRATTESALAAIEAEVERIGGSSALPDVKCTIILDREIRPMERSEGTAHLYELARGIAGELGIDLAEAATGGGSDANRTGALGVPTLDGLGPIGGDDHSEREWMDVRSIAPRTALLAGLIASIGQ